MKKKTVILIKSNLFGEETRRPKLAGVLKDKYKIIALSWDRCLRNSIIKQDNSDKEIRLKLKAPLGVKSILFLPFWWSYLFFRLILTKWDVVHVINFDSIIPAILVGKIKKRHVVYEILDVYTDQIVLPNWIRYLGIKIEKFFIPFASAIILADEKQIEEMNGIPNPKIIPIYDSPIDTFKGKSNDAKREGDFTLFFAGMLSSDRKLNLNVIFSAIQDINNVNVVIAGHGDMVEDIKDWADKMPNKIQFIGKIPHIEVMERTMNADLLFVLRDPVVPVNKYICGSKLLETMMCGKPIFVNIGTSTADKVLKENCGLVVDANNIEEIKEAIIKLRDNPEICEELGANGREAYEYKYSWKIMEQRLFVIYRELIDK